MGNADAVQLRFRRLLSIFALCEAAALVMFIGAAALSNAKIKSDTAERLAETMRAPLIQGDMRSFVNQLSRPLAGHFHSATWTPAAGGPPIRIPPGRLDPTWARHGSASIRIFFDEAQTIPAGNLTFHFDRWTGLHIVLLAWLLLLACSFPFLIHERNRLAEEYSAMIKRRSESAYVEAAEQLAHDIKAPIASLRSLLERQNNIPTPDRILAAAIADRIESTASDLLLRRKGILPTPAPGDVGSPGLQPLRPILESAAEELRLTTPPQIAVRLEFASEDVRAPVIRPLLFRIVSNLLQNSLDAIQSGGVIKISLRSSETHAIITVEDDGPGIPPDVLGRLGTRGATFGKRDGSGLGLWHAKSTVDSWGGRLEIESELGKGTTVRLILPRADEPDAAPAGGPASAVLIDDDPLVRMNWSVAAKRAEKTLKAYPDTSSFIKEAEGLPRNTPIYLDSDLGEGVRGEDKARELAALGFTELYLETGHDPASLPVLPHLKAVRGKEPPWTVT